MSTSGIMGFAHNGEAKVTYNHYDSYPEGLGLDVLAAARVIAKNDVVTISGAISSLRTVTDDTPITQSDIDSLVQYTNTSVGSRWTPEGIDYTLNWYQLTRGLQGNLLETLAAGYMRDANNFALDSLFCEWGYVIDFNDDGAFLDVYEGFKKPGDAPTLGLWENQQGRDGYKPISRIARFELSDLPSDEQFVRVVTAASRYADEDDD